MKLILRAKGFATFSFHERGFTLIELLIVIAVVGVLGGGVLIAIDPAGKISSANLAVAETFSASMQNNLAFDLVGEWTFDDGSLSPVTDTSGYGNNGSIAGSGVITTTDRRERSNKALGFDGNGDYVSIGNRTSLNSLSRFTLTAWIKMNDRKYIPTIINKGPEAAAQHFWWGIQSNDTLWLEVGDSSGWIQYNSTAVPWVLGKWYFVAVTLNNDIKQIKHYRNGALINIRTYSGRDFNSGTYDSYIGCYYGIDPTNYDFNGSIDDVRIYKQAFSLSQAQQLYAQGLPSHLLTSNIFHF